MSTFGTIAGGYFSYRLVKTITKDWKDMEAFKLGVIDAKGKIITPPNKRTPEQKRTMSAFNRLAFNLKRFIEKVPVGLRSISSVAAAAWLLKENGHEDVAGLLESVPTNTTGAFAKKDMPLTKKPLRRKPKKELGEAAKLWAQYKEMRETS